MTTPQQRLHRLIETRRKRLRLTQAAIQAHGGPSPAWIRKLPHMTGEPDIRSRDSLEGIDRALRWPPGTSWSLLADDRSTWAPEVLEDEETRLIEEHDEVDAFTFVIGGRLRAMTAKAREEAMTLIMRLLDLDK